MEVVFSPVFFRVNFGYRDASWSAAINGRKKKKTSFFFLFFPSLS
jgi:hypothetical protein